MYLTGVEPLLETPTGVEVTERWQGERRLLFVLNHLEQQQKIELNMRYTNLLDGKPLIGDVQIEPLGVLILAAK